MNDFLNLVLRLLLCGCLMTVVSLARSNATNSGSVLFVPFSHFLIRPCPLKRVGIKPVVFRPSVLYLGDELRTAGPRAPLQVAMCESVQQQFRLVQPRGMHRREATSPPAIAVVEVLLCRPSSVGRVVVVDQVDSAQVAMTPTEARQPVDVVLSVLRLDTRRFHLSTMDDQQGQNVDRAMPGVLKLLLFHRARDGPTNRRPFQDLAVGLLIDTQNPVALAGQSLGVGI
jgi:hypothetical protein